MTRLVASLRPVFTTRAVKVAVVPAGMSAGPTCDTARSSVAPGPDDALRPPPQAASAMAATSPAHARCLTETCSQPIRSPRAVSPSFRSVSAGPALHEGNLETLLMHD